MLEDIMTNEITAEILINGSFYIEIFSAKNGEKLVVLPRNVFATIFEPTGKVSGAEAIGIESWSLEDGTLSLWHSDGSLFKSFPHTKIQERSTLLTTYDDAPSQSGDMHVRQVTKASQFLSSIPEQLEFSGEFGEELNSFIPYVYWLFVNGEMHGRSILTYAGMEPFYYFLRSDQIEIKKQPRQAVLRQNVPSYFPHASGLRSIKRGMEWSPPYRKAYQEKVKFDKPILVVHNKYTTEWGGKPVNFLSLDTLDAIFSSYKDQFQIIFFESPRNSIVNSGYSKDHQKFIEYDDYKVALQHPEVIIFGDYVQKLGAKYNDLKLKVFSNTYHFITTQGGNSHMAALFPGSLVIILHVRGGETKVAYKNGVFQYLTNNTPSYFITKNSTDLLEACQSLTDAEVVAGRLLLGPRGVQLYKKFNPWASN